MVVSGGLDTWTLDRTTAISMTPYEQNRWLGRCVIAVVVGWVVWAVLTMPFSVAP